MGDKSNSTHTNQSNSSNSSNKGNFSDNNNNNNNNNDNNNNNNNNNRKSNLFYNHAKKILFQRHPSYIGWRNFPHSFLLTANAILQEENIKLNIHSDYDKVKKGALYPTPSRETASRNSVSTSKKNFAEIFALQTEINDREDNETHICYSQPEVLRDVLMKDQDPYIRLLKTKHIDPVFLPNENDVWQNIIEHDYIRDIREGNDSDKPYLGVTKTSMELQKRTYQPSVIRKKRNYGFLSRLKNRHGRAIIRRRRTKGRSRLAV